MREVFALDKHRHDICRSNSERSRGRKLTVAALSRPPLITLAIPRGSAEGDIEPFAMSANVRSIGRAQAPPMSRRARTQAADVRVEVYARCSTIVGSEDRRVDALESIAPVLFIGLSPIAGMPGEL